MDIICFISEHFFKELLMRELEKMDDMITTNGISSITNETGER